MGSHNWYTRPGNLYIDRIFIASVIRGSTRICLEPVVAVSIGAQLADTSPDKLSSAFSVTLAVPCKPIGLGVITGFRVGGILIDIDILRI